MSALGQVGLALDGHDFGARTQPFRQRLAAARLSLLLFLLCGGASLARAQAQPKQDPKAPKVIQLEEVQIEGRIQKPNAFYILNRSSLGYEVTDLRTRFMDGIIRAVADAPF